jgi:hypothetical protein
MRLIISYMIYIFNLSYSSYLVNVYLNNKTPTDEVGVLFLMFFKIYLCLSKYINYVVGIF